MLESRQVSHKRDKVVGKVDVLLKQDTMACVDVVCCWWGSDSRSKPHLLLLVVVLVIVECYRRGSCWRPVG